MKLSAILRVTRSTLPLLPADESPVKISMAPFEVKGFRLVDGEDSHQIAQFFFDFIFGEHGLLDLLAHDRGETLA